MRLHIMNIAYNNCYNCLTVYLTQIRFCSADWRIKSNVSVVNDRWTSRGLSRYQLQTRSDTWQTYHSSLQFRWLDWNRAITRLRCESKYSKASSFIWQQDKITDWVQQIKSIPQIKVRCARWMFDPVWGIFFFLIPFFHFSSSPSSPSSPSPPSSSPSSS